MTNRYKRLSVLIACLVICGCASLQILRPDQKDKPDNKSYLYSSLTFDVAVIVSCQPAPEAFNYLRTRVDEFGICKGTNVSFCVHDIRKVNSPAIRGLWTLTSLLMFRYHHNRMNIGESDSGRRIFVGYIRGVLFEHPKIRSLAGIQLGDHMIFIFKDVAAGAEESTLWHEFLHTMGLKQFSRKPYLHCGNPGCVMYPIMTDNHRPLCQECREELITIVKELRRKTKRPRLY